MGVLCVGPCMQEVTTILMQRLVKVDGKTRIDKCYPAGFMGECPLCSPACKYF